MTRTAVRRTLRWTPLFLLLILVATGGTAHAVSSYLNAFNTRYGTSATRLNSCTLCHPSVPALNPYASAYAAAGHQFPPIEAADSDGDGASNLEEIRALTFPGDPNDKPAPPAPPPASPSLTLSPPSSSFGNVTVGLSSAPVVTTIANGGNASLAVTGMTLSDTADYSLDVNGGSNPCGATTKTLAPGTSCTVALTFSPKTAGVLPGTLTVASNDPAGADMATLTGTGVAAPVPRIAVSPASGAFGTVTVGGTSAPVVSTISNTGTASLSISSMSLTNPTDFSLNLSGGTNPCGTAARSLAAGASCTVALSFSPKTSGAKSGRFDVASSDPARPTASVPLTGTGAVAAAPKIAASPTLIACGNVTVGSSSAPRTLTVSNSGSANLVLGALSLAGADASEFGLQNDLCSSRTLVPGGNCTVQAVFSPAVAAARNAVVSIPSNDPAAPNATVAVTGTGVTQANTPPAVVSTTPGPGASGVAVNSTVAAVFSETMSASSLTTSTFTLAAGPVPVYGTVSASGTTATFTPSAPLAAGTLYTATITTGAKDLAGAPLASAHAWSFTTAPAGTGDEEVDSDGDGCEDGEDEYPHDNRRSTPRSPKGRGKIRIDVTPIVGAYLTDTDAHGEDLSGVVQTGRPQGYHFNDGLVSFRIHGGSAAGTARMEISYPSAIPAGSRVYRVSADGYHEMPDAVISDNTVTVPVTVPSAAASSTVQGLLLDGTGTPDTTVVGVASPDASAGPSSSSGCNAAGGGEGAPIGLALSIVGLALRGLVARMRS